MCEKGKVLSKDGLECKDQVIELQIPFCDAMKEKDANSYECLKC